MINESEIIKCFSSLPFSASTTTMRTCFGAAFSIPGQHTALVGSRRRGNCRMLTAFPLLQVEWLGMNKS